MLWQQPGALPHLDLEEVAPPLPSAVYKLVDAGSVRRRYRVGPVRLGMPARTPTALSLGRQTPKGSRPKCPLFPIRKERTDWEHTGPHQYTFYASGPTVLYSWDLSAGVPLGVV